MDLKWANDWEIFKLSFQISSIECLIFFFLIWNTLLNFLCRFQVLNVLFFFLLISQSLKFSFHSEGFSYPPSFSKRAFGFKKKLLYPLALGEKHLGNNSSPLTLPDVQPTSPGLWHQFLPFAGWTGLPGPSHILSWSPLRCEWFHYVFFFFFFEVCSLDDLFPHHF